jgi:GH25 family lysozyme M1 (1,4-beta-N-acetylmuramidase)
MKSYLAPLLALANGALATVSGFDISHYQGTINYAGAYAAGARFVIIKVNITYKTNLPHNRNQKLVGVADSLLWWTGD